MLFAKWNCIFTEIIYLNKSIKILINWLLAPGIFIIVSWSLYNNIINQKDLANSINQIKNCFTSPALWLACVLMIANWGVEAFKWQILLKPLEKISFLKAYKSVLAGCSITMLTPYRVGEYGGRIFYVKDENRLDAIPLTILGSMSQLFVTLIIGSFSLLNLRFFEKNIILFKSLPTFTADVILYFSLSGALFLVISFFKVSWIVRTLGRIKFLQKIISHLALLSTFSGKQLLRILFLSFLRYSIFILQYILLLKAMQVNIDIVLSFKLIAIFYLVIAMAPTIGFTELPLRAALSVEILQLYSANILGIQAAVAAVFFINLVVPAITGSLLILGIKIIKEK